MDFCKNSSKTWDKAAFNSRRKLSSNLEIVDEFIKELNEILTEGGYTKDQIYNCDESGLFWRGLHVKTLVTSEETNLKALK